MLPSTEFLNPRAKLVDEVADWLKRRVRDDASGAKSLAHLCVVVPTAQSGRNLRLALAKRFERGILPPQIVQPMELVVPEESATDAISGVRAAAAFLAFARGRETAGKGLSDSWPRLFGTESATDVRFLLGFFDRLEELWTLLGAGGLLMRDVPENESAAQRLADAGGDESSRWEELAELEGAFFSFLRERGLRHRAEAIRAARAAPPPIPSGVEEVVLPALADPVPVLCDVLEKSEGAKLTVLLHSDPSDESRFDKWGRPDPECWTGENQPALPLLRDGDVACSATDADMARRLAEEFAIARKSPMAPPALCICDDGLFRELAGAFLAVGIDLHDPEKRNLSESSLGRVLAALLDLRAARDANRPLPWAAFARLMRENDVLLALAPEPEQRAEMLAGLDICRNAFLPSVVPDGAVFDEERVRYSDRPAFRAFRKAARRLLDLLGQADADRPAAPEFLLRALRAMFSGRRLREDEGAGEFRAAAKAARQALDSFGGGLDDAGLSDEDRTALVRKALSAAAYSLETPHSGEDGTEETIVKAAGWLELPWSASGNVALAGFHEGAVPQTSTGHLFLPDQLRDALGLPTNARRLARDTFLLSELLASRSENPGPGSVRVHVARTNDAGDVHRPSRLLFLVHDAELPAHVKTLFGDLPAAAAKPAREIAPGWRPRLPLEVPLPSRDEKTPEGRLSASSIDKWIGCPLSYLFSVGMGMDRSEDKEELGYDDFGTIVHAVLEDYANEQIARTERGLSNWSDPRQIREFLHDAANKRGEAFGAHPSTRVALQLDAVKDRLMAFAAIQAAWARDGWVVCEAEKKFLVRPFEGEGATDVRVKGSIDRIDFKEGVGYRLIDYKTWDDKEKALSHVLSSGKAQTDHAAKLKLPTLPPARANGSPRRILSVQLPLYARCLEKADPATFGGRIADLCYLVLGKDEANACVFGSAFDQGAFECQRTPKGKIQEGKITLLCPAFFDYALDTARRAVAGIRANLFWPPGPGPKYDLDTLFLKSPASDLEGTPWLAEQKRRLAAFAAEKGGVA